jgi:hypothetical protein
LRLVAPRCFPGTDLVAQGAKCGGVVRQLPEQAGQELRGNLCEARLRDRVRMACSLGAVVGGLSMAGDAFNDVSPAELGSLIRDAVHDLLGDRSAQTPVKR